MKRVLSMLSLLMLVPMVFIADLNSANAISCQQQFQNIEMRVVTASDNFTNTIALRYVLKPETIALFPASQNPGDIYITFDPKVVKDQAIAKAQFDGGVVDSTMNVSPPEKKCDFNPAQSFPADPWFIDRLAGVQFQMIDGFALMDQSQRDLWTDALTTVGTNYQTTTGSLLLDIGRGMLKLLANFGIISEVQAQVSTMTFSGFLDSVGEGAKNGAMTGAGAGCAVGIACTAPSGPGIILGGVAGTGIGAVAGSAVGASIGGAWYVVKNTAISGWNKAKKLGKWLREL